MNCQGSQVRYYASAVFPFSDRQKWTLVMAEPVYYTAYMDDTGTAADDAQHFCGMAGFLAPADKWESFESKWKQTLKEFKIPYFHMKEFGPSAGIFEDWKGKELKRRKLYGKLLRIISSIHPIPLGSIVSLDAFRKLSPEDQAIYHDPYLTALRDCSGIPGMLLQNEPPEVKYAVVFSQQAEFRHRSERIYEMITQWFPMGQRMMYPDFKNMRDLVPLQAADIIAYELNREFGRQLYQPAKEPRYGYKELVKMARRVLGDKNPFVFHSESMVRLFVSTMKTRMAGLGISSPNYSEAWRNFYAQLVARPKNGS